MRDWLLIFWRKSTNYCWFCSCSLVECWVYIEAWKLKWFIRFYISSLLEHFCFHPENWSFHVHRLIFLFMFSGLSVFPCTVAMDKQIIFYHFMKGFNKIKFIQLVHCSLVFFKSIHAVKMQFFVGVGIFFAELHFVQVSYLVSG